MQVWYVIWDYLPPKRPRQYKSLFFDNEHEARALYDSLKEIHSSRIDFKVRLETKKIIERHPPTGIMKHEPGWV